MRFRSFAPTIAAAAMPLVITFCKGATEAKVASGITISPGSANLGAIGASQKFSALVTDQGGNPITGAVVGWRSTAPAVATVDTTGLATAVGDGVTYIKAETAGIADSVLVTVAQVASQISKAGGDGQQGVVGTQLGVPVAVQLMDATGHAVPGAAVAFAASGGGSVGAASVTTDASGAAQTTWTLGHTAGSQTASATVSGVAGSPVTFTATAVAGAVDSIVKAAGDSQTTATGAVLAVAPSVRVADAYGNPKSGVSVTFAVASGGGSVAQGTQLTGVAGVATVGGWTLGSAGTNTLTATVAGTGIAGNPVTFTATAVTPGAAATIAKLLGDGQTGLVGYALNVRPAVKITDANGIPVAGTAVTFHVTGGAGTVTDSVVSSNADGIAQVGAWTIGSAPGTNTLSATAAGLAGSPIAFTASGQAAAYTIQVLNIGPTLSAPVQTALDSAVAKWERIIYKAVGTVPLNLAAGQACGDPSAPAIDQTVTGLLILAKFDSIDGPGQILGQSGPCYIRTNNWTTIAGIMEFDTADVATLISHGSLNEVMLHEMGHVIGFGTLWDLSSVGGPSDCLQDKSNPPSTINDTYFDCKQAGATNQARAEFDSIGGTAYTGASLVPPGGNKVPVENCGSGTPSNCGAGTVNAHWREPVFGNELMTGYINSGSNPLSVVTVASIGDLGYGVNYAAADPYTPSPPFSLRAPGVGPTTVFLGDDVRHGPIYVLNLGGQVVQVIQSH